MSFESDTPNGIPGWELADGAQVPEPVVIVTMMGLKSLLEQYGPVAAIDLKDLIDGKQPVPSPFGNPIEIYPASGLAEVDEDGKLHMHNLVKDVVRNAVHSDPTDPFRFSFTDPRTPFSGFDE